MLTLCDLGPQSGIFRIVTQPILDATELTQMSDVRAL